MCGSGCDPAKTPPPDQRSVRWRRASFICSWSRRSVTENPAAERAGRRWALPRGTIRHERAVLRQTSRWYDRPRRPRCAESLAWQRGPGLHSPSTCWCGQPGSSYMRGTGVSRSERDHPSSAQGRPLRRHIERPSQHCVARLPSLAQLLVGVETPLGWGAAALWRAFGSSVGGVVDRQFGARAYAVPPGS